MKYKVGDRVRIVSKLQLDNKFKPHNEQRSTSDMNEWCGEILTIRELCDNYYIVSENSWYWSDWMIDDSRQKIIEILRGNYKKLT